MTSVNVEHIPVSQRYFIGRQLLDGAEPDALADKIGMPLTDIENCWAYCQEQLSQYFSKKERAEYRKYDVSELTERIAESIEFLLTNQELHHTSEKLNGE